MNLGPKENCVPLLLIVYPEMSDIIIPANWGMAFWLAFAYAGARAGISNMVSLSIMVVVCVCVCVRARVCVVKALHTAEKCI